MSGIMDVRKRRRDAFKERHNVGLGFMSFFTKAVIGALKAYPRLNAEIQGEEIVLKEYYDIGIAVGTDEGLVVPVVRDADRKSFAEIQRVIADLATRARSRELTLPELVGGTFTITNGGIYGSLLSTPILNAPQVGDPGHAQDPGASGGGQRPGDGASDDVSGALLRSSDRSTAVKRCDFWSCWRIRRLCSWKADPFSP